MKYPQYIMVMEKLNYLVERIIVCIQVWKSRGAIISI